MTRYLLSSALLERAIDPFAGIIPGSVFLAEAGWNGKSSWIILTFVVFELGEASDPVARLKSLHYNQRAVDLPAIIL